MQRQVTSGTLTTHQQPPQALGDNLWKGTPAPPGSRWPTAHPEQVHGHSGLWAVVITQCRDPAESGTESCGFFREQGHDLLASGLPSPRRCKARAVLGRRHPAKPCSLLGPPAAPAEVLTPCGIGRETLGGRYRLRPPSRTPGRPWKSYPWN